MANGSFTGGIQEAIDALPAPSGIGLAGAVSLIPGMTYSITKTIWLHPGTILFLNGATIQRATGSILDGDATYSGAVIAAGPRGANGTHFSIGNKGENIYIIGPGTIDGNQSNFTSLTNVNLTLQGFRCHWTRGLYISNNVRIQNTLMDGIYLNSCLDWLFNNLHMDTVGQWSVPSSRNALSLVNNDDDATYSNRGVLTNFDFTNIGSAFVTGPTAGAEAIAFVGVQGVSISNGTIDGCDFAFECTGGGTVPFKGIRISSVDIRNLRSYLFTMNQTQADASRIDIGHLSVECDPTHNAGLLYAAGSGYNFTDSRFHHITATNVNAANTDDHAWVDFQSASEKSRQRVFVEKIVMSGDGLSSRTEDTGVVLRHPANEIFYDDILIKDIPGIGVSIEDAGTETISRVHVRRVFVDGANYDGFYIRINTGAAIFEEILFDTCTAKDCCKVSPGNDNDSGFKIITNHASAVLKKLKFRGCRSYKTSGSNHKYGLSLDETLGSIDDVEIEGSDFSGCDTAWFKYGGTPTNIKFKPPNGRGTNIASAATIAIPPDGTSFHVTGTTNITSGITVNPWDNGRFVELVFDSALTISSTGTSKLDGNFRTVSGNVLALFCDGTNWNEISRVPQTKPHQVYSLVLGGANTSTAWTVDPAGAGTFRPFGGTNLTNLHLLDFSSYTEARLHARCKSRAINASATAIKIVDITNSKDVTNTSSFTNDGNWHTQTTLWRALDAATIVGLATFELEGSAGSSTDILDVGTVILELRRG